MRLPLAIIALLLTGFPGRAGDDAVEAKVLAAGGTVTRNPIFKLGRPIQEVWLGRGDNGDELLASLTACKRLTRLRLNGSSVTNEGLEILPRIVGLEELDLVDTRITDDGMASVGRLERLRTLRLGLITQAFSNDAAMRIRNERFKLGTVTDDGLRHVAKLKSLESLGLNRIHLTDDGLDWLAKLPNLKRLSITRAAVTDSGLKVLSGIRTLEELRLSTVNISDEGLTHLAELNALTHLDLSGNRRLTAAGLRPLAKLRNLRFLRLVGTDVSDADTEHFRPFEGLEILELSNSSVTPAGRAALRKALPKCVVLPADASKADK